jgi:hypothetical protein
LRETSTKPRLLVLAIASAVALLFAALAVFAAEARAGSFDNQAPKGVLMKYDKVLQTSYAAGSWVWKTPRGWSMVVLDNFGEYYFPKKDEVPAGSRLHVRFDKPERPDFVAVNAWPRVEDGPLGDAGKTFAGPKQRLKFILKPVKRDGKTVKWDVFFRTNEPDRDYYLKVTLGWKKEPGSHASYGQGLYGFHVETR